MGASRIVALVFTDVVDSTTLGNVLGDERWIEVLRKHFSSARFNMIWHDCYEVKIIGDSFMVAFRDVVNALDFALYFHENTGDDQVMIRAGIHVGPVRIIDNDMYGLMVNYTKRVESTDNPHWIMISDEVKKQIHNEKAERHSDLEFQPRSVLFKGFSEPQTIWRVSYPNMGPLIREKIRAIRRVKASLAPKKS